jgi:hypothetical protein
LGTQLGRAWLLLVSLPSGAFLTNKSTELNREHYLGSTTINSIFCEFYKEYFRIRFAPQTDG